jgi:hypothetical protein
MEDKNMKKISAMFVALAMIATMFVPLAAAADEPTLDAAATSQRADTTATVTGTSGGGTGGSDPLVPVIERSFVLHDADGFHGTPGTQIVPNIGSGNRLVRTLFTKYAIVSSPFGVSNIAKVEERLLDGTVVVHSFLGLGGLQDMIRLDNTANKAEIKKALDDALAEGLITQDEHAALSFKLDPEKNQAVMFKIENYLDNHDHPGVYTVQLKVIDQQGRVTFGECKFDYMTIRAIELDFNTINYGTIAPGIEKDIAGDPIFANPGGLPTIKDQGNVPIKVKIRASDLQTFIDSPIGRIREIIPASALSVTLLGPKVFDLSGNGKVLPQNVDLQPCTPTQIDFDIKAPIGTAQGVYTGSMFFDVFATVPDNVPQAGNCLGAVD